MERRDFLKFAACAAAGFVVADEVFARNFKDSRRPNFVFILVDDLGWRDLGCFGSRFYETPNVDKLASEGMRFTDAYAACPVCSPTRASIMTGKYPARLGLTDWIPGRQANAGRYAAMDIKPPAFAQELALTEVTIAEALKKGGYSTFHAGKWHLGKKGYYPEDQGFDVNIGGCEYGSPPGYFWPWKKNNRDIGLSAAGYEGEYLTDRLVTETLKFIESHKDGAFFVYLSFYTVHIPLEGKKELIEKYRAKAKRLGISDDQRFRKADGKNVRQVQDNAIYAAMVETMDSNVGRVMAKLDELGIGDDTVIIFMSDNGGLSTAEGRPTSNLPLRAGKGGLYEGGIREPMIVKWPGVVKGGSECNEAVVSCDFYPTMLEVAGLEIMDEQHIDGVSFAGLLTGKGGLDRDAIYWHYPHYSNQGGVPGGGVRCGDWKLIEWFENGRLELYNLKVDIAEKHDLSGEMAEKVNELHDKLLRWRRRVDASMPIGGAVKQ